jgi:hypothetical protein
MFVAYTINLALSCELFFFLFVLISFSTANTTLDWAEMLTLPPGAILYMSILQCGLRLCQRYNSYVHAETPHELSLLRGPLVAGDGATPVHNYGYTLADILARQSANPFYMKYKAILEISREGQLHIPAVSILPHDTLPTEVQTAQARHPTATQDAMAASNPLFTAIDLDAQQPHHERRQRTSYLAGETQRRGAAQTRPLHAQADGTTFTPSLTVESALFPFLFPQGKHFFNGTSNMTLGTYLEQRMMALFSPWTLLKEYPLLMYQVGHCLPIYTFANNISSIATLSISRSHTFAHVTCLHQFRCIV